MFTFILTAGYKSMKKSELKCYGILWNLVASIMYIYTGDYQISHLQNWTLERKINKIGLLPRKQHLDHMVITEPLVQKVRISS